MKHLGINKKVGIVASLFFAFILLVDFYVASRFQSVGSQYGDLFVENGLGATDVARSARFLQNARAAMVESLLMDTAKDKENAAKELELSSKNFEKFISGAIEKLPQLEELKQIKASGLNILNVSCANFVSLAKQSYNESDRSSARGVYLNECQPAFASLSPMFTKIVAQLFDTGLSTKARLEESTSSTVRLTMIFILGGFFVVAALGYVVLSRYVVGPINKLARTMSVLASHKFDEQVEGTERRDEVGKMAKAVQVFKDNGLKALALEAEAVNVRTVSEAERAKVVEADRERNAEMAEATSSLADGLRHLSQGDLSFQLTRPFASDFEGLRADFNSTVVQLRDTLAAVADATRSIDGGSRELSSSASDLSKRTEQQAVALEETAAALDQITVNVSNATKRTEEARSVALEANRSAEKSEAVVADAVNAMQRIEKSSNQISNIIGVIDEIAFQTNLLALNAGVEAARAGEAGKGFAVVAQEVRELAQRSAQAAKEIKDLIRTSANEVESGVKLVSATGGALKMIGGHVVAINGQLDAIATAAREQSVGLSEVNTAVNQMDQTTQQNAAMVEEATAASATLAGEADKLRELVGRFQLGGQQVQAGGRSASAPVAASASHAAVASPARQLLTKLGRSTGGGVAAASWEEF